MPDEKNETTSQEDFTSINQDDLTPELLATYKSMQADYSRKTQALASQREEFTDKETKWEEQLVSHGAVEQENKQWRDWYQKTFPEGETQEKQTTTSPETSKEDLSYLDEPGAEKFSSLVKGLKEAHSTELSAMQDQIENLRTTVKDTTDQTSRMFNYHAQLAELGQKYEGLDKQELLDHALKTGQPDLESAYKVLHQDELIDAEVALRLEKRLKEERTKGIQGPGQQVILRPTGEKSPKSFAEASELVLQERAAQGL